MYHITKLKPIRIKQSIQLQNDTKMKEHIILPNDIINYIMESWPKDKNYKSPIVDILSITARRSYDDRNGIQRDYTVNVVDEKRRHILNNIHTKDVFMNGKDKNYNHVLGVYKFKVQVLRNAVVNYCGKFSKSRISQQRLKDVLNMVCNLYHPDAEGKITYETNDFYPLIVPRIRDILTEYKWLPKVNHKKQLLHELFYKRTDECLFVDD
jgi:hypothetical protein